MDEPQNIAAKWIGLIFFALGILAAVLIIFRPAGLNVPIWLALIGALTFVFAGLSFLSQSVDNIVAQNLSNLCLVTGFCVLGWFFLTGSQ